MNLKSRYWLLVCYPESLPSNWLEILKDTLIPCAISPLHDLDITDGGELKKEHYHILICFDGPTTYNNIVKHFSNPLNAPIPKVCLSPSNAYAYFTHKNDPDKAQYNEEDIITLNGFTYRSIDGVGYNDDITKLVINCVLDKKFKTLKDCVLFFLEQNNLDAIRCIKSNVLFFKCFF